MEKKFLSRKRGYKYKAASAGFILNEIEELCAALADGTIEEQQISEEFKDLARLLQEYYNRQGWL